MRGVYEVISSPLGEMVVAEIDGELAAILFASETVASSPSKSLSTIYPSVEFVKGHVCNLKNVRKLLNGQQVSDELPISKLVFERCSDFRKAVYEELLRIPRGSTKSYAEIALQIGRPKAYRAVAQSCAANVLPIVIPCHRVVGSNGSLGGYSAGIDLKQTLLKMESE